MQLAEILKSQSDLSDWQDFQPYISKVEERLSEEENTSFYSLIIL